MLDFLLNKFEREEVDEVFEHMQDMVIDETGEKLMTLAQQLIQKGVKQGVQQGINLMAKRLLARGLSLPEVHQVTELPLTTLRELQPHAVED